jgi:hypothetical protein
VVLDASQSAAHMALDVKALGVDFMACTAHKMLGPTGIGMLYGRRELLEAMPPFLGGGEMIRTVSLTTSTWNELPWKFEAGTMAIAEAVGLGAAVQFLEALGMENVFAHDRALSAHAMQRLAELPEVTVLGPAADRRGGVVAFSVQGVHPHRCRDGARPRWHLRARRASLRAAAARAARRRGLGARIVPLLLAARGRGRAHRGSRASHHAVPLKGSMSDVVPRSHPRALSAAALSRHAGEPDARVEDANPLCGDRLTMEFKFADGRIAAVRFTGTGCSISQAAASLVCEAIEGVRSTR